MVNGNFFDPIISKPFGKVNGSVDRIIRNAPRATCGVFEKEANVKAENVSKFVRGLKQRGYNVIGTSYGNTRVKKVWFVPQGMGSL